MSRLVVMNFRKMELGIIDWVAAFHGLFAGMTQTEVQRLNVLKGFQGLAAPQNLRTRSPLPRIFLNPIDGVSTDVLRRRPQRAYSRYRLSPGFKGGSRTMAELLTEVLVWVEGAARLAVPAIALLGAVYTLLQYQRVKRWRAGDLAVTEELAFACRALDWGTGPLIVPERYRPLLERIPEGQKDPTPMERGAIMQQNPELLARAVQVYLAINPETEPAGLIYRYCFDKLFAHLADVHRLVASNQIKLADLAGLKYWLERIAIYEYAPAGIAKNEVFRPFLNHQPFGYRGVINVGERLGVPGWIKNGYSTMV
jgi:hypothetical protein